MAATPTFRYRLRRNRHGRRGRNRSRAGRRARIRVPPRAIPVTANREGTCRIVSVTRAVRNYFITARLFYLVSKTHFSASLYSYYFICKWNRRRSMYVSNELSCVSDRRYSTKVTVCDRDHRFRFELDTFVIISIVIISIVRSAGSLLSRDTIRGTFLAVMKN